MNEGHEINVNQKPKRPAPILQLNRQNFVKISGKVLDSTSEKLDKYIAFASEEMNTKITSGDVIEHGLKLLFDRDRGFKTWLKDK